MSGDVPRKQTEPRTFGPRDWRRKSTPFRRSVDRERNGAWGFSFSPQNGTSKVYHLKRLGLPHTWRGLAVLLSPAQSIDALYPSAVRSVLAREAMILLTADQSRRAMYASEKSASGTCATVVVPTQITILVGTLIGARSVRVKMTVRGVEMR